MPHIHTSPGDHDLTVSAYIFRRTPQNGDWLVLVQRHRRYDVLLPPAGHVEVAENPWHAMLRELREEVGYRPHQLQVAQPFPPLPGEFDGFVALPSPALSHAHCISPTHIHADLTYVFTTDEDPVDEPAPGESRELQWMTVDEWGQAPGAVDNAVAIARHISAHVLDRWTAYPAGVFPQSSPSSSTYRE